MILDTCVKFVGAGVEVKARTEQRRVLHHVNRARLAGLRHDLSAVEWLFLLMRFEFRCAYCERPFATICTGCRSAVVATPSS